jgi:hypothetical protein
VRDLERGELQSVHYGVEDDSGGELVLESGSQVFANANGEEDFGKRGEREGH